MWVLDLYSRRMNVGKVPKDDTNLILVLGTHRIFQTSKTETVGQIGGPGELVERQRE